MDDIAILRKASEKGSIIIEGFDIEDQLKNFVMIMKNMMDS